MELDIHCPRAGPGQVEAIFAGPDPDPQGQAILSLALAPGRFDPCPVGLGCGGLGPNLSPWYLVANWIIIIIIFFFQLL